MGPEEASTSKLDLNENTPLLKDNKSTDYTSNQPHPSKPMKIEEDYNKEPSSYSKSIPIPIPGGGRKEIIVQPQHSGRIDIPESYVEHSIDDRIVKYGNLPEERVEHLVKLSIKSNTFDFEQEAERLEKLRLKQLPKALHRPVSKGKAKQNPLDTIVEEDEDKNQNQNYPSNVSEYGKDNMED